MAKRQAVATPPSPDNTTLPTHPAEAAAAVETADFGLETGMLSVEELLNVPELAAADSPAAVSVATEEPAAVSHTLILPPIAAQAGPGYCPYHVDVKLSGAEAVKLRRLTDGLRQSGTMIRIGDGSRLADKPGDVVRWLLQQIPG